MCLYGGLVMINETEYYLVDVNVLPEVFLKVVKAKKLLSSGVVKTINDAVKEVGISRSAFYKYKEHIFPFYDTTRGNVLTIYFLVLDKPGILSQIINVISTTYANILTINQSIPINGLADITITIDTINMRISIKELMDIIFGIDGLKRFEILARE
jgi:chorismate mutase